jgi:natural product biosynthesis luciferase-like monooxygenase protein
MSDYQAMETILNQHWAIEQVSIQSTPPNGLTAYFVPSTKYANPLASRNLKFSLFYFADAASEQDKDKYQLYLAGAQFADRHGFEAVWTPERHFHENGGLYPNPAVLSSALAVITKHIRLRAGSVALPLHHPLRVAEEWSVVDNLSNGRVDISFTSGWIPNDFAIAPQPGVFAQKRDVMFQAIEQVQTLWQGGLLTTKDGVGNETDLKIFPKPVQSQLPVWLTCSGDPEMFIKAGKMGFNVLTALLTQSLEEAAEKADLYRQARSSVGLDPNAGQVTLMLHTFVGEDETTVKQQVAEPLTQYLRSHIALMETMAKSLNIDLTHVDINDPKWADYLASFAFERYYRTSSLIGTTQKCLNMINRLKLLGFDEVACLIDFGIEPQIVLNNLHVLHALKLLSDEAVLPSAAQLQDYLRQQVPHAPTHLLSFKQVTQIPDAGELNEPLMAMAPDPLSPRLSIEDRAHRQKDARVRQRQQIKRGKLL